MSMKVAFPKTLFVSEVGHFVVWRSRMFGVVGNSSGSMWLPVNFEMKWELFAELLRCVTRTIQRAFFLKTGSGKSLWKAYRKAQRSLWTTPRFIGRRNWKTWHADTAWGFCFCRRIHQILTRLKRLGRAWNTLSPIFSQIPTAYKMEFIDIFNVRNN